MEKRASAYTVRQLANMAGVSVRTLHHYDHIGLLRPSARTAAGYRLYGTKDLLRLQQILLFKEFDLPLEEIRRILDDPGFDPVRALAQHRRTLELRAERLARLLNTIDRTIARLTEVDMSLTDEELYEGLPKEQVDRWKREVDERYDPKLVAESNRRVRCHEQGAVERREGRRGCHLAPHGRADGARGRRSRGAGDHRAAARLDRELLPVFG